MNKMRMNKKLTNISHGSFLLGFVFNMHLLRITMADHNNRENITTMELQKQLFQYSISSCLEYFARTVQPLICFVHIRNICPFIYFNSLIHLQYSINQSIIIVNISLTYFEFFLILWYNI